VHLSPLENLNLKVYYIKAPVAIRALTTAFPFPVFFIEFLQRNIDKLRFILFLPLLLFLCNRSFAENRIFVIVSKTKRHLLVVVVVVVLVDVVDVLVVEAR
jgi:hypothetical protein